MKQLVTGFILMACWVAFLSCDNDKTAPPPDIETEVPVADTAALTNIVDTVPGSGQVNTKDQSPENIVAFAKTLIGVPYKYGSTDPAEGFDCSGFITYVFNHFNIEVPRSSVDFTNVGTAVDPSFSKTGDLILFTGTDTLETKVGHMGIITDNTDSLRFIHSTSGKKYGVTITALNEYYLKRFVKVVRIF